MIATCQFCKQIIHGPDSPAVNQEVREAYEYRQLSMLVAAHMGSRHTQEAGNEIAAAMSLAGAAIAMRYVDATDPAVHQWRNDMGEALMTKFQPAPPTPITSLQSDQAAAAPSSDSGESSESAS